MGYVGFRPPPNKWQVKVSFGITGLQVIHRLLELRPEMSLNSTDILGQTALDHAVDGKHQAWDLDDDACWWMRVGWQILLVGNQDFLYSLQSRDNPGFLCLKCSWFKVLPCDVSGRHPDASSKRSEASKPWKHQYFGSPPQITVSLAIPSPLWYGGCIFCKASGDCGLHAGRCDIVEFSQRTDNATYQSALNLYIIHKKVYWYVYIYICNIYRYFCQQETHNY